jgi:hypothetical protein
MVLKIAAEDSGGPAEVTNEKPKSPESSGGTKPPSIDEISATMGQQQNQKRYTTDSCRCFLLSCSQRFDILRAALHWDALRHKLLLLPKQ